MAYRKVAEENLTAIADAIRAKSGGSDGLVFPDGFLAALESIEAGGGGGDIAPFTSVKCGTFVANNTKTLTIDGVSNCKIFAMRCIEESGYYSDYVSHIVGTVLVNTEASLSGIGAVKGISVYFDAKFVVASSAGTYPTISGDTLTFNYALYGTYEYVMVSK